MGPHATDVRRALTTVRSSREIDDIFRKGDRSVDELLTVFSLETSDPAAMAGRVVFIAGRKVGNAVLRNRCKRVIREAVRRAGGPWPGHDVALVARAGILRTDGQGIERSLSRHLLRLGLHQ